jgi:EAL domain-containing protein (putative c-di-GMP-specific phosphodiesterase class I)
MGLVDLVGSIVASKSRQHWTFDGVATGEPTGGPKTSARQLRADDMDVVFQPIVDLASGKQFGVEALARCKEPSFRDPLALFEQAERDHAVGYVGRLVRDVAFSRCDGVTVFVNLHPAELSSRWLVRPDDPLNFHDAPVFLEVTETAAFEYFDLCRSVTREVCARSGAKLVIDDFGAGYSNLKRIIDLEPAIVKLDRELTTGLDRDRRQRDLVRYVVQLCEGLGARVVAEGIETVDELKALRDAGAHYGQGYLLARPAPLIPEVCWPLTADGRRRPSARPKPGSTRPSDKPRSRTGRSSGELTAARPRSNRPSRRRSARPGPARPSQRPKKSPSRGG